MVVGDKKAQNGDRGPILRAASHVVTCDLPRSLIIVVLALGRNAWSPTPALFMLRNVLSPTPALRTPYLEQHGDPGANLNCHALMSICPPYYFNAPPSLSASILVCYNHGCAS